jgi:succinate dehydrogenase / fumarate reductase flavoprotein subunit
MPATSEQGPSSVSSEPMRVETDVLVIGAGGAGMYAAIEAARGGCRVLLIDRSLIGRGGATVMAQMTVAVAIGSETPDHWSHHFDDTVRAGRGLCDEALARLLCEEGPECIGELDAWGVGWARKDGRIAQITAPGHDRARCAYVDFINTGPAVSKTLRSVINRTGAIRKAGDLCVIDLIVVDGEVAGALALQLSSGAAVIIAAKATVLATGGLTRLYQRNSASANMGGDGYAMALRAGAELIDMEFVQFFPIGHLAPRLIGMDPIMWDPFRYKLGGRLLNGAMQEFTSRYGSDESGRYILTRDLATYAIMKEVEAGRGSPHGGAYLSFQHCSKHELQAAFGPVIDRLAANDIDLTKTAIEVAPIAHYHMGGVRVDAQMQTRVPGLLAAGEAVGGANGANRLSGNAITEALVFGRRAGRTAAARAGAMRSQPLASEGRPASLALLDGDSSARQACNAGELMQDMQRVMWNDVGPFRTGDKLARALATFDDMTRQLGELPPNGRHAFDLPRLDWLDLRNMLLVARTVAQAALQRTESRGAHQREDFPALSPEWEMNQLAYVSGDALHVLCSPLVTTEVAR